MIEKITKIALSSYLINDVLLIRIKEDSTLEITYDEKNLNIDEVHELIQEFLEIK